MAQTKKNKMLAEKLGDNQAVHSFDDALKMLRDLKTTKFDEAIEGQCNSRDLLDFRTSLKPLLPFESKLVNESQTGIPFGFQDYLTLLDWTGRMIRVGKRGYIDSALPPILMRLQITADQWHLNTTQFEAIHAKRFSRVTATLDTG